ncbi:dnaJ homolog subfamily B member 6-like [Telopea speciosissima]|uniref:dnaJ homolog subfamily B member 6-like n=1 Tax=Telopea speciosissima TaxID=54955 RepID=UPI001CC71619|nr:dnaJ homolog subfamily B member 6-like [Telopea speciosissima]
MADGEEKSSDFYAVLGLKKECTATELKKAYKKLALRWHPDRCSASGNSKHADEAKKNFQSIQEAYSVLSDSNKRFLYDLGAYDDDDDDDENGMGDFLGEMTVMMSQTNKSSGKGQESFKDLQELFDEMFQSDMDAFHPASSQGASFSSYSSITTHIDNSKENKRACSGLNSERSSSFDAESMEIPSFCIGVSQAKGREDCKGKGGKERRRNTGWRKS